MCSIFYKASCWFSTALLLLWFSIKRRGHVWLVNSPDKWNLFLLLFLLLFDIFIWLFNSRESLIQNLLIIPPPFFSIQGSINKLIQTYFRIQTLAHPLIPSLRSQYLKRNQEQKAKQLMNRRIHCLSIISTMASLCILLLTPRCIWLNLLNFDILPNLILSILFQLIQSLITLIPFQHINSNKFQRYVFIFSQAVQCLCNYLPSFLIATNYSNNLL